MSADIQIISGRSLAGRDNVTGAKGFDVRHQVLESLLEHRPAALEAPDKCRGSLLQIAGLYKRTCLETKDLEEWTVVDALVVMENAQSQFKSHYLETANLVSSTWPRCRQRSLSRN